MFGRISRKDKDAIQRRKARKRKLILLLMFSPLLYLLGSGPALWSRSQISNKHWRKGVIYYVAPVMWLNYQLRDRSLIEQVGVVDLTRSENTEWYGYLEKYWSYFGKGTVSEAGKITMMLKIKFHGS
jgi:hypothetical protein